MDYVLRTKDLTKQYGQFTAVDDLNWSVNPGETKAIIGPNGAGKTTLFNMISGHISPTSGHIMLNNEDITNLSESERARRGVVKTFQRTNIFGELTVFENIRIASQVNEAIFDLIHSADALERVNKLTEETLDWLDMSKIAGETVENLSYGDQRKIEIGIALATEPSILLLDEPTAGIAIAERDRLIKFFEELSKRDELTLIITEHDMEVVHGLADSISVLHRGGIIAEGTSEEIMNDDQVERVYLGEN